MQSLRIIKKLSKLFYLLFSSKRVVEKSNEDNLKVIKYTLPNKSGNPESLKNNHSNQKALQLMYTYVASICESILQVILFMALCFKLSVKKHCAGKILQGV